VNGGDTALVVAATFGAGFLNAAAGGGSLLSFPALVAAGLPPLTANVSNTLALWPGYLGGTASLRSRLEPGRRLRQLCVAAAIGAVLGSAALLVADSAVFEAVVPFLVLMAAALLAVPPRLLFRLRSGPAPAPGTAPAVPAKDGGTTPAARAAPAGFHPAESLHPATLVVVGLAGAYGAYFGGALGVVLIAVLNAAIGADLRTLNATKALLSLLVNTVALVAFVGFAPVNWTAVAIGAPASLVGGVVGGVASTRIEPRLLRWAIVAYATVAGLVMLVT
jgi:uncharacterized membrane protein YfcA